MSRGLRTLNALVVATAAAIAAPLRVRGRRLEGLLHRAPVPAGATRFEELPEEVAFARRASLAILRRLAWPPLSPWRNTCLYRSVAECQTLRHYDIPATIRLGVRNESPPHGPVVVHAWVVYPGGDDEDGYVPLASAGGGPASRAGSGGRGG